MSLEQWEVSSTESGCKLQAFLKVKLNHKFSAKQIKQAIENNKCLVNGKTERFASYTLGTGDKITWLLDTAKKPSQEIGFETQRVLYEDADLLIYDKPAGIASDNIKFLKRNLPYLSLVHRLDLDTTGALIFAKNEQSLQAMIQLFKKQLVQKEYLAIVDGVPSKSAGIINNFLGKIHSYEGQTLYGEVTKGLSAITEWRLESKNIDVALLRCIPKTGRTHQIRVHLSGIGHPILGDYQYGRHFRCSYRPHRYLLHAFLLQFPHPSTGKEVKVMAPLPNDFEEVCNTLRLG